MFSFQGLLDTLSSFFYLFVNAMITFFVDSVDRFMVPICQALPQLSFDWSLIASAASFANYWLPLNYGLVLFLGYLAFITAVLIIKWILGLIPTLN